MQQRALGRTGEQVSAVGLGGFHMAKGTTPEESTRIIRTAIDGGITFMDNSWDYHDGESERRMGNALRDGYRERVFLMTKIDGHTKAAAAGQLEQSLSRMQVDTIDLVQFHEVIRPGDPDAIFAPGGAAEALIEARQAGKLRYIGFTGHKSPEIHLRMLAKDFPFDAVQMPLNPFDGTFDSFEQRVLPVLVERGIAPLAMKTLGGGALLKAGVVTAEECLRYALSLPTAVVIAGCQSLENLEQALRAGRDFRPYTPEEMDELRQRVAATAAGGGFEPYKTTGQHDGTDQHPEWLVTPAA